MKQIIAIVALTLVAAAAQAQGYGTGSNPNGHGVSGYTRSNGTYVEPYRATNPDSTQRNNYGTIGNINPSTGQTGTHTPRY